MIERYLCLSLASLLILIYIIISISYKRKIKEYEQLKYIENARINQLYSTIGYLIYKKQSKIQHFTNTKLIISIKNLYGENKLNKELNAFLSHKFNKLFFISIIFLIISSFISQPIIYLLLFVFIILYSKLLDNEQIKKYKKHQDNLKKDLPAFISRLYLLILSGLNLRLSIKYILNNTDGEISKSFRKVQYLIDNGMSENEAYNLIIVKSDDVLIRKFISNIIQNLEKGGDDLEALLQMIKKESDEFRKTQIILKTQEANSKLLIPNLMIFAGILIIVMVPLLFNIL